MKRLATSLVILMVLIVPVVACGGTEGNENRSNEGSETAMMATNQNNEQPNNNEAPTESQPEARYALCVTADNTYEYRTYEEGCSEVTDSSQNDDMQPSMDSSNGPENTEQQQPESNEQGEVDRGEMIPDSTNNNGMMTDQNDDTPSSMGNNEGTENTEQGDTPIQMPNLQIGSDVGNLAPDFTLPYIGAGNTPDNNMLTFSSWRAGSPAVVVFYRTYFCIYCKRQINEINSNYDDLQSRGVKVVAISSDRLRSFPSGLIANNAFPLAYTSLDDTVPSAYDRFGNVPDGGYLGGVELADPGVFLVDANGVIVWKDVGNSIGHIVYINELTSQIDNLLANT